MSAKDDNGYPVIYGVSDLDGVTPVRIRFSPSDRSMLVDAVTSISFNPSVNTNQNSTEYPFAKATSSADDSTTKPWVVNHSTGAVLIDM